MTRRFHSLPDDDPIGAQAAAWLAQREEGFDAAQTAEFAAWCAADERHAAAVAELEHVRALLVRLPQLNGDPACLRRSLEQGSGRPALVIFGPFWRRLAAVAAAGALVAAGWWLRPDTSPQTERIVTTVADQRRTTLSDGSIVELNTDSEVEVRYTEQERSVALVRGEVHFTVAKNPARPFVVAVGHVRVRAVGTAFNVRVVPDQVEVLVTEGRVALESGSSVPQDGAVAKPGMPKAAAPVPGAYASAGQRAVIAGDSTRIESVDGATISRLMIWKASHLVFADTPLSEVVAQFNRRNRVKVELEDAALAGRPVGGNFEAENVEAFIQLLEESREIVADRSRPGCVMLRRAR